MEYIEMNASEILMTIKSPRGATIFVWEVWIPEA